MTTTTKETNSFGIALDWLWGVFVLGGTSYLVFFKGISPWWFIVSLVLLGAQFPTKKTVVET